jgi:hypothetical protein
MSAAFHETVSVVAATGAPDGCGEALGLGDAATADRAGVREGDGDGERAGDTSATGVGSVHAMAIAATSNKKLVRRMIPSG